MIPSHPPARVLFLADSGPAVGGGHLMRCLSLAEALVERGSACAFVAPPDAHPILDAFAPAGVERLAADEAPSADSLGQAAALAQSWGPDVLVVDHYGLWEPQERRLRGDGRRLVVIDDLADRRHDCALLIDAGLGRTEADYRALVPAAARVLAGPAHALLRPEYARARPQALARRAVSEPPRRVLLALGLTDLKGITGRVLNIVRPALEGLEVDVVAGAAAPSLTFLKHLAKADARIRLHVQTRDMAGLMAAADVAIGAGGSSAWERACLGLPSICLVLAENQRSTSWRMDAMGAALAVEAAGEDLPGRLLAAFERLVTDGALRARLSETSAGLCDGLGAGRVADAVLGLVG